ncbi:MAG: hypothetical protein KIT73_10910 [Burkholderiales bacterium]|nr:hypothetical protein [Burkholderiales bacterium]
MNADLARIHAQRARLVATADAQRDTIAALVATAAKPLNFADLGIAGLRMLGSTPVLVAVGTALLSWLGPRKAFTWVVEAWGLWQLARKVVKLATRR